MRYGDSINPLVKFLCSNPSKFVNTVKGAPQKIESNVAIKHLNITVSTEQAIPPTSTESRNSDSSVSRGTNSNRDCGFIWICTEEFEFLDLDFGGVAFLRSTPQKTQSNVAVTHLNTSTGRVEQFDTIWYIDIFALKPVATWQQFFILKKSTYQYIYIYIYMHI